MMKSIAFFLGVFTVGLVGLLLVSGDLRRWISGEPAPGEAGAPAEVARKSGGDGDDPNTFRVPIWDPVKGRLDYTIRGHLDDQAFSKLQDIQDVDSLTLKDGQLDVPIYNDSAKGLPAEQGEKKPQLFTLTFARAEYNASFRSPGLPGVVNKERVRETIRLLGDGTRGMGKMDDGSTFRFEELTFEIDRLDRKKGTDSAFTIHSTKPVSIQNGYLRLESPAGLDGVVKNKGLQKLIFFPPVRTYLDPRAARLFSLGGGGITSPVETPVAPAPGQPPPTKVAITCEGPMTFFLDLEPPSIRFEKDVIIYPLAGAEPAAGVAPPPPGPTRFHCQLLVIEVDSKTGPPRPSRAVATWDGGRVKAYHRGKVMEGAKLEWSLPPAAKDEAPVAVAGQAADQATAKDPSGKPSSGEAVLTGEPRLSGDEGWLDTGEIHFRLDEDRVLLTGGLKGEFRTDLARGSAAGEQKGHGPKGPGGSKTAEAAPERKGEIPGPPEPPGKREKLPDRWEFLADDGEIVFAARDAAAAEGPSPTGARSVERMTARSLKDGGVVIKSQGDGRFRLDGRTLTYNAPAHTITIEGSPDRDPRFVHEKIEGSARTIQLRTDEGLVSLEDTVSVKIEEPGSLAPQASEPSGPEGSSGPVELLARAVDLRFDDHQRLLGAEARGQAATSAGPAPVVLRSLDPAYRLTGERMRWDQVEQVATVEGPAAPCAECRPPELLYEGGRLVAESIRFDRKLWRVSLLGRVDIDQCAEIGLAADPGAGPAADRAPRAGKDGFELSAARADVDLYEDLRSNEKVECGPSKELRKVKKIHAFEGAGDPILIRSRRFRGTAQEAVWDAESRELHFFGPGQQRIVLLDAGRESDLIARDIVYQCATEKILFGGEVHGELRIESTPATEPPPAAGARTGKETPGAASTADALLAGSSTKAPGSEVLTFQFETNRMEVTVRETEKGLEPATLRALDKVFLLNKDYGVQLDGDELFYDDQKREVRIYSDNGRHQKLTHTRPAAESPDAKAGESLGPKVDQIESREIRLHYILNPSPPGKNSSLNLDHLVVKFKEDVTATFFLPMKGTTAPGAEITGPREEWKMQSDHLGIRLVPNEDRLRSVQLALAEGNVIFRSGDYMAIAQEAIYDEALKGGESLKKLRLRGDGQKPARLFNNAKSPPIARAAAELVIYKRGESNPVWVEQEQVERQPSLPAGLEELRAEPRTR
jgi:hypothetical protein